MANVDVAVQNPDTSGITPTYQGSLSTSDTYRVPNNGRVLLHFKKSGAGACTVTFKTPRQVGGLDVAEKTATVPATTGDKMFKNFPTDIFNVPGTGYMEFTLSEVTGLTMAAIQG